jgi:hypothetical protein
MAVYIPDVGDLPDRPKGINWDFPEDNIPTYVIGKYVYKATTRNNALILDGIRSTINSVCDYIEEDRSSWENSPLADNINLFLGIHKEYFYSPTSLPEPFYSISKAGHKTSRYLLSEIPKDTMWSGLNKPKMRYIEKDGAFIGPDQAQRALYRDVFLNLNDKSLEKLVIHEISHTMANHVNYRPDDHKKDFKDCEKFITSYWN